MNTDRKTDSPIMDKTWFWPMVGLGFFLLYYALRPILTPFLVALFVAYICRPLICWFDRKGLPRTLSACLVILLLALLMVGFMLVFVPLIQTESLQFFSTIPQYVLKLNDRISPWVERFFGKPLQLDFVWIERFISDNLTDISNWGINALQFVSQRGMALVGVVINFLMTPLILFYALRDWEKFIHLVDRAIPRNVYGKVTEIVHEMDTLLSQTIRGQLLVVVIQSFLYGLALSIAGLNFAFVVGLITGILSIIPYIGFSIGFIVGMLIAVLQFDSIWPILGVLCAFTVVQIFESFFLTPNIVGDRIGLHPVGVIFALLAFGELFGFTGILIALPATSLIVVGLRHLTRAYTNSVFYKGNSS